MTVLVRHRIGLTVLDYTDRHGLGFCHDFSSGKETKTKLPKFEKFHYYIIIADF